MADLCNLCGKPGATLMCQRCMETYCSTNCQILDWRVHKKVCIHMPALVPIKDYLHKENSFSSNRSMTYDSPKNRPFNDSFKGAKRAQSPRNPLKIPTEIDSFLIDQNNLKSSQPPNATNQILPDIDFTLKPKNPPKENIVKSSLSLCSNTDSIRNSPWRTPYPFPKGELFDVIVQYAEEGENVGIVWVTDLKYESPLRKLLGEINRNIDVNNDPCRPEEIQVGALVAAPFENLYYRAEIKAIAQASKQVNCHLIDYGNLIDVSMNELRSPIPIMRNLNAYAFRIRYTKPVALEEILKICVFGVDDNGIAIVEAKKTMPDGLTAEVLASNPIASLVKVSENGTYALIHLENEDVIQQLKDMNKILESDEAKKLKLKNSPTDGDYVAALTLNDWSRAIVLNKYRNYFLVYLLDVGRVALVEQVLEVPEKYKNIPMQIFAIEIKTMSEWTNLLDRFLSEEKFTIKASPNPKTQDDRFPCFIVAKNSKKMVEIEAFNFIGQCEKIGVNDWIEPLKSGSVVYISSVVSHREIFISTAHTKLYTKIFTCAAEDCEALKSAKKGDLVLAKSETEFYRGRILGDINNNFVKVLNIDTGVELKADCETMRKPNLFVLSCPNHTRKVKLIYLANVETPYVENKALATLQQCQESGAEFIMNVASNSENSVELLLRTPDQQSLNKQLLPMLFEKISVSEIEQKPTAELVKIEKMIETPPPSPVKTAKIFTYSDLKVLPMKCGDNITIMILDCSTISQGHVTACDCSDKVFLKKMESEYLPLVSKYCDSLEPCEYLPSVDEICLAIFDADKEWYRALCMDEGKDDMFLLMFLDYGNISRVHKSNIRKIPQELMFPANANLCVIDGLPKPVPPRICEKFALAVQTDPKIVGNISKLDDDSYLLKIKNKDQYF